MSKANKLASLAVDVNNLSDLADQVTDIENAIVRANTNAQLIDGIADDIEALEANTTVIMNDFADISNVFNSGITYSTDGVNEYYDANSVTNTVATVDIIEMNIQNPQDGELLSYSSEVNTWVNSAAPVIPEPEAPVLSFRNKIINGDMRIDQRNGGASVGPFTSGSAGYKSVDRWFIASDSMTSQQITGNTPTGFSHYLKLTKGSGSNIDIRQTVELSAAGQAGQFGVGSVWTLSFYAKSVTGSETLNFNTYFRSGVATGTFTAVSAPTPNSVTLTTNWTRYSVLFTIDVSPGSDDLCIAFGLNTTATELHLTGVQLEEGSVATPFEHRPYGLELSLCQRYLEAVDINQMTSVYSTYLGKHYLTCEFKTTKRVAPSATSVAITNYQPGGGTGTAVMEGGALDSARIYTGSQNSNFNLQYINNGHTGDNAIIIFDAEL
jgi:hypothetical protein